MKGRVLSEMFDDLRVPKAGPSWDAAVPTVAPPDRLVYQPDAADAVQRTRELVEAGLVHPPELTSRRSAMTVAGENRWNLGIALLELRRPSEALPMLHEALLAMPESPAAAYYLVRCLFALGLIDEAEQAGRMFADFGPRNVRAEVLRAHILTARRKFEEALRVLGEVRELELTEERTTLQRHLLLQLGRFEEARAAFVEALTIAPEASHHYLGLAYALLGLRRREEACAAARQALARDCTLDSAKAILAGKYDDFARLSRKPPDFVGPSWEQLALDARPRILLRKEIRERERRFLVARREARAAEQPAGLTPACVSVAAVPAATDKPSAGQGSAAERASVRSPWRDEFARIDRAFLLPKAPSGTRRSWLWVMVAGEFERLVGVACLHEIAMPASATAAAGIEGGLDLAVRRNWQRDLGVRQLVNRALAQAQESGLRRVSVVTDPATALIESLTAAGFVEADRQEIRTIWVAALRGFFAGPRGQALTRQPVDVAPLAEASLDAVRRICSHYELLSPDRVHALGAVGRDGFDPRLSFFTGHPERPTAILLAREANGLAYLEVLARAPLVAEAPIPSALALLQAFVNAVHALGLMEINCAIQPAKNPGLASLIRRHGILLEGKAVYRWEKA
jgi:hypothetical protein